MKQTDKIEISAEKYAMLIAIANTFYYLHSTQYGRCPKCGKYILIMKYACFGCGYDRSVED